MKKISKKEIRISVSDAIAVALAKFGVSEYSKKLDKLVSAFAKDVSVLVKKTHKKTTVDSSAKPAAKAVKKPRRVKKVATKKS
ncbi:hypothetical protein [Chryseolinea lacunae]|uniref:Histone n=1 Tax=Chryseolinea lacunae TaxID=2801331 RepID=A0ABS1L1Z4_9BACT|nr:hypothetical protein [Chryseolinea lacunae]MBL0745595.1 hypothetical protein [Chryseolinea lacunae]